MTPNRIFQDLETLRTLKPVIHNVTNFVAMQTNANILLALGASPIMAHADQELADIIAIAKALVINMGTLDPLWMKAMTSAQHYAQKKNIPIIFDPVGAGASEFRTQFARHILQEGVQLVRGNASEIMALMSDEVLTKGVDATEKTTTAWDAAEQLAKHYQCTVIVSGEMDIVTNGQAHCHLRNGTPLFTQVTAMGCSATAVIGAFAAINPNYFHAAIHAMTVFAIAGEKAAKKAEGPGTFSLHLIDALAQLTVSDLSVANIQVM